MPGRRSVDPHPIEQGPEIERTLQQLRRDQEQNMGENIPPNQAAVQEQDQAVIQVPLNNLTRPLKDFTIPRALDQPSCIILPPNMNFEKINSGTIHLLPTFYGKSGEDPHCKDSHLLIGLFRGQTTCWG